MKKNLFVVLSIMILAITMVSPKMTINVNATDIRGQLIEQNYNLEGKWYLVECCIPDRQVEYEYLSKYQNCYIEFFDDGSYVSMDGKQGSYEIKELGVMELTQQGESIEVNYERYDSLLAISETSATLIFQAR